MDTSGFSQIGRYGTLALMKTHEYDTAVTAFGIDTDELTFGRDPTCGVRLYYPDVSLVHCKIVFEERKAFLIVLGDSGLLVDGCKVFPNGLSASKTIPLINNSEIVIHGKRFRFAYPPKELREALFATPARPSPRALRLSMIHSAQVFSPRPSQDPRENLRILKTPLKNSFKSPLKRGFIIPRRTTLFGSPAKNFSPPVIKDEEEDQEDEEIVLVDGNHPRVVEEEKDLVILEDVEIQTSNNNFLAPLPFLHAPQAQQPQTPARSRSVPRSSLHRAVLIRSAQRAVIKAEREREEQEEEMEVFETVASEAEEEIEEDEEDNEMEEDVQEEQEDEEENPQAPKLTWRKSLEKIWPFQSSSSPEDDDNNDDDHSDEEEDVPAPLPVIPPQTPARRPLGSFMTPQVRSTSQTQDDDTHRMGRYSVGGVEARRVPRPEQVWRVKDIVVPQSHQPPAVAASPVRPTRTVVDDEERKAIRERRRSALKEVDSFFPGGVPGMGASPAKVSSTSSSSSHSSASSSSASPLKPFSPIKPGTNIKRENEDDGTEEMDTRRLLERMKDTVEGMKRRKSLVPATPVRPTLETMVTPYPTFGQRLSFGVRPASPTKASVTPAAMSVEEEEEEDGDRGEEKENVPRPDENGVSMEDQDVPGLGDKEEPLFSLLRPGVLEERRTLIEDAAVAGEGGADNVPEAEVEVIAAVPVATSEEVEDQIQVDEDHLEETKTMSKVPARRTRITGKTKVPQNDTSPQTEEASAPATKPPSRRGRKPTVEPEAPLPVPVPIKRGRKPATATATATAEPERPLVVVAAPAKRGRKPAAEVEAEEDKPVAAHAVRKGRKPASAAAVKSEESEETPVPAPARRGRPPKIVAAASQASGAKRGAKTKMIEVDDDVDPLDSLKEDEAPKPKGGRRKVVKEEVPEDEVEEKANPIKNPRGRSTAVKTPVAVPAKSRVTRKTPATAPAAVTGTQGVDKENTPGSDAESGEEPVKVRVSRTTRKVASGTVVRSVKVKAEEELLAAAEVPKGRVMRATRARTRT